MTDNKISMTWPQYKRRECLYKGNLIKLTRKETEVLMILLMNHPRPVTSEDLIVALYFNNDDEPDWSINCIAQFVRRLKKKIDKDIFVNRPYIGYHLDYGN